VQLKLRKIVLSSIRSEDKSYLLAPEHSLRSISPELIDSISQVGVLHPPLVQANDKNDYIIISGFKRIAILQNISPNIQLHCLILPIDCSQEDVYTTLFHHWVTDRQPSIIEQAAFFSKTNKILSKSTLLSFTQQLGYKPTMRIVNDLISLLKLESTVITGLHNGSIHPRSARKIQSLNPMNQKIVASLITTYKLGGSKQQKMIDLGMELIMRKKFSWSDIRDNWLKKEDDKEQNIPQQSGRLLEWLNEQCYPQSSLAESEFTEFVRSLKLPANATVSHVPSFEGDELWMTIKYANKEELRKKLPLVTKHTTD